MSNRVYVSAPSEYGWRAEAIGKAIVAKRPGTEIVSRWHSSEYVEKYPSAPSLRADAVAMNMSDMLRADTFVILTDCGEPRSTFVELGIAIMRQVQIIWFEGSKPYQRTIFDAHASVSVVQLSECLSDDDTAAIACGFLKELPIAQAEAPQVAKE